MINRSKKQKGISYSYQYWLSVLLWQGVSTADNSGVQGFTWHHHSSRSKPGKVFGGNYMSNYVKNYVSMTGACYLHY